MALPLDPEVRDGVPLEFGDINRGYRELDRPANEGLQAAWREGRTGYPLIDASMRCLLHTGYVNFRSRAMLVSFFCHHLWQHWRDAATQLAALFLDFEPGIHYAQLQMQARITGTNTICIHNPVKQSHEHDPDGSLLRYWLPELRHLPDELLHAPWEATPIEHASAAPTVARTTPYTLASIRIHPHLPRRIVNRPGSRVQKAHVVLVLTGENHPLEHREKRLAQSRARYLVRGRGVPHHGRRHHGHL
jgi:deoxyribodipyrimidine photolyase